MEWWSGGVMECWSDGVMEYWKRALSFSAIAFGYRLLAIGYWDIGCHDFFGTRPIRQESHHSITPPLHHSITPPPAFCEYVSVHIFFLRGKSVHGLAHS